MALVAFLVRGVVVPCLLWLTRDLMLRLVATLCLSATQQLLDAEGIVVILFIQAVIFGSTTQARRVIVPLGFALTVVAVHTATALTWWRGLFLVRLRRLFNT
jgi:hypothetical protein